MKPVEFLQIALESISKNFPNVHIKYGYNTIINTHRVELLPISEYRYNSALDEACIPLSFKFREVFPKEEIAFVSSDSKLSIDNPILEFNAPSFEDVIAEVFARFSEQELNYTFPTCIPNQAISIENSIVRLLGYPTQNPKEEMRL
ncbi:MAG: hypothetical protein WKG06_31260 [Segetibacter sp.]